MIRRLLLLSALFLCGALVFAVWSCTPSTPSEKTSEKTSGEVVSDASDGGSDATPDNTTTDNNPADKGSAMEPYKIQIDSRGRAASMLLPETEFKAWLEGQGFQKSAERQKITKKIYDVFKDSFDFIFFVMNTDQRPTKIPFGQLIKVSNAVKGVGIRIYSNASQYGSAGKLKAVMQLGRKDYLLFGPSLHELMHNWGNFILDTKMLNAAGKEVNGKPHWGVSDVGGQLGGFDRATFQKNVDGNPNKYSGRIGKRPYFGFNSNGGNGLPYSNLELYLMGLLPKSEVKPVKVFSGISADKAEFGKKGAFTATKMVEYSIDQIVGAPLNKGERVPGPDKSQKSFRVLALMLTPKPLTTKEWDDFDKQIASFSFKGKDRSSLYNFWEATGGRASLEMGELSKEKK